MSRDISVARQQVIVEDFSDFIQRVASTTLSFAWPRPSFQALAYTRRNRGETGQGIFHPNPKPETLNSDLSPKP